MNHPGRAVVILTANTLAFTACFAVWMMNGVLVTFLDASGIMELSKPQIGWLLGAPVLTGALLRLPAGILTDRYGGRPIFAGVMVVSAAAAFLTSFADGFWGLLLGSLGFGVAGSSFAVGVAYTSVWVGQRRQGTALGIFGAGNMGAALTALVAPSLLAWLTFDGTALEGWRGMPRIYAAALLATAVLFWLVTTNRRAADAAERNLAQRLEPLRHIRVWRFGLYYFFAFGGFVALAQWLIPYYVNMYSMSLITAGLMASIFALPSAVVRALGGWLSDVFTARTVMYWSLGSSLVLLALLFPPRMDIQTPGPGIMAAGAGVVTAVSDSMIIAGEARYQLTDAAETVRIRLGPPDGAQQGISVFPTGALLHEPVVKAGDTVVQGQLLARGITHIYFQANVWIFSGFIFLLAIAMGCASAAVFTHIPRYFPQNVGVVGGLVGVIGALGGFVNPIIFGYLLEAIGIWTTCWMYLFLVALCSLLWMHLVIRRMRREPAPGLIPQLETVLARRVGVDVQAPR